MNILFRIICGLLVVTFLTTCSKLTPLTPDQLPLQGEWVIAGFHISGLPTWYLDKTVNNANWSEEQRNQNGYLLVSQNVTSYTFTSAGTVSEEYLTNGAIPRLAQVKVDQGKWSLKDSIVSILAPNLLPSQLIYRPDINELATRPFSQTAIVEDDDTPGRNRDTVSYTINIKYAKLR